MRRAVASPFVSFLELPRPTRLWNCRTRWLGLARHTLGGAVGRMRLVQSFKSTSGPESQCIQTCILIRSPTT